jgi:hypothetical protein
MDSFRARLAYMRNGTEGLFLHLRRRGFNPARAIRIVARTTGVSALEAKRALHASAAWADVAPEYERFHRDAARAIDALVDEDPGISRVPDGRV